MADLRDILGADGALPPADFAATRPTPPESLEPAPVPPSESLPSEEFYGAPWEEPPKTRFEQLYDEKAYKEASEKCPQDVISRMGRFNPFEKEYLALQINERAFSTFLNRRILYFDDALKHASAIVAFWQKEDRELEALRAQDQEKKRRKREERDKQKAARIPTGPSPVEEARIAWKKGVEERKKAMAKWDAYVAELHHQYKLARERK